MISNLMLFSICYSWCYVYAEENNGYTSSSRPELREGSSCVVNDDTNSMNATCRSLYKCTTATRMAINGKAGFENKWPPIFACSLKKNGDPVVCCTDCYEDYFEECGDRQSLLDALRYSAEKISGAPGTSLKGNVLMNDGHIYAVTGPKAWTKFIEYYSTLPYRCRGIPMEIPTWQKGFKCISYDFPTDPPLAIGGAPAKIYQYPHMALLGYGAKSDSAQWLCGGSIISERFILSAAHCSSTPKLGNVTFAALGLLKRSALSDNWKIIYDIKTIIKHPEYRSPSKYHDIMLLKTASEISFGISVLPACLDIWPPTNRYKFRDRYEILTATGWGRQGPNGVLKNHLQVVELHRYSDSLCSELFPPHRLFTSGYNSSTQMCYGRKDKAVDTCEGDSGGPLQYTVGENCFHYILGITSFGKDCGIPGNAGIYTRVRYYVPWIESIVWPS